MTNADMMVIFDVIITIMGTYIIFSTIKMKKDGMVPNLFVPVEEMTKCKDQPGFIAFLFPRAIIFGLVSAIFGIEGVCNDMFLNLGQIVNVIMIVVFIVAWVWFSMQLRKGKEKFF